MTDKRMKKLAEVLVNYSVKVKPGDWVYINSSIVALPLLKEVYKQVLLAGGNPTTNIYQDDLNELFYKNAGDEQLEFVAPNLKLYYETADVMIHLRGAENTRALSGVDPKKQAKRAQATRPDGDLHGPLSNQRAALGADRLPLPGVRPGSLSLIHI